MDTRKDQLKEIFLNISNQLDADQNIDFDELAKKVIMQISKLCLPHQKDEINHVLYFQNGPTIPQKKIPAENLNQEFCKNFNTFLVEVEKIENDLLQEQNKTQKELNNIQENLVKRKQDLNELPQNEFNIHFRVKQKFEEKDKVEAKSKQQNLAVIQEQQNAVKILKNQAPQDVFKNLYARLNNIVDPETIAEEATANRDRPEKTIEGDFEMVQTQKGLNNIVDPETIAEEARANRDRPEKTIEGDVELVQTQKGLDPCPEKRQLSQQKLPFVKNPAQPNEPSYKNSKQWPNEPSYKNPIQRIESSEAKIESPFFKFILQSQEHTDLNGDDDDEYKYKYKQNIKNVRKAKIYYQTSDRKLLGIIIEGESDQQIYRFGSCKEKDSESVKKDEQSVAENKKLVGITFERKEGSGVYFGFKFKIE